MLNVDGLHHDSSLAPHGGSAEAHSAQAAEVVAKVLSVLDKDGDGIVTLKEFTDAGNGGLPDFKGAHLGHHYGESSRTPSKRFRVRDGDHFIDGL